MPAGDPQAHAKKQKEEEDLRVIPGDQVSQVQAHQLVDFDWKLKYAVPSDSLAAINEPIERVNLRVSKETVPMDPRSPVALGPGEGSPQTIVAEYTKPELARLIADLEQMVQVVMHAKTYSYWVNRSDFEQLEAPGVSLAAGRRRFIATSYLVQGLQMQALAI